MPTSGPNSILIDSSLCWRRRPGLILFNVSNEYRRISSSLSERGDVNTRPHRRLHPCTCACTSQQIRLSPQSAPTHTGAEEANCLLTRHLLRRGEGGGAPRWPPFHAPTSLDGRQNAEAAAAGGRLPGVMRVGTQRNTCLSRRPSNPDHLGRRPRRQRLANPPTTWRRDTCVLCMRDLMRIIVKQRRISI